MINGNSKIVESTSADSIMFNYKQRCLLFALLFAFLGAILGSPISAMLVTCIYVCTIILSKGYVAYLCDESKCYNSSWIVYMVVIIGKLQKLYRSWIYNESPPIKVANDVTVELQTDKIVELISRDFVKSWFILISDKFSVVDENRSVISQLKKEGITSLASANKYLVLTNYVKLYHKHLSEFQSAKNALTIQPRYRSKAKPGQHVRLNDNVEDIFITRNLLHYAMHSQESEITYLSTVIEFTLKQWATDDLYKCFPGRELVTEILSRNVLSKLLEMISDPYWLHFCIIKLTSDEIIEVAASPESDDKISEEKVTFHVGAIDEEEEERYDSFTLGERPSPVGCNADEIDNVTVEEIEVRNPVQIVKAHTIASSIELAERNGLFDISNITSAFNPQSMDGVIAKESSGIEEAEDVWSEANERFEQPLNLVVEISVPESIKTREHNHLGHYTLYCIKYLAWYKTNYGSWQIQERTVKRRYREFVALQERIEEHPVLHKQLRTVKGIRGPSKWLNMPFSRMDEAHIEKRRIFLQQYLISITDNRELSFSLAVREFLAYDSDPGIAFVRKPSDVQRIDQVFVKTVKNFGSALGKLADSFPSLTEPHPSLNERLRKASRDFDPGTNENVWISGTDPDALDVQLEVQLDVPDAKQLIGDETHESILASHVLEYDNDQTLCDPDPEDSEFHDAVPTFHDVLEVNHTTLLPNLQKEDDCSKDTLDAQAPLTQCLLDLALQTIQGRDCWVQEENAVRLFKVLLGRFLDTFVRNELDDATTPERCAYYFLELTDTLWPDGEWDDSPPREISPEQRELTRKQARRCLYDFFPGFLPLIIGVEDFNHAVDEVMASLDHPLLNRHFALCLLDVMVEEIFPDIRTAGLQKELLRVTDSHFIQDLSPT